jgi:hypothetical protein
VVVLYQKSPDIGVAGAVVPTVELTPDTLTHDVPFQANIWLVAGLNQKLPVLGLAGAVVLNVTLAPLTVTQELPFQMDS